MVYSVPVHLEEIQSRNLRGMSRVVGRFMLRYIHGVIVEVDYPWRGSLRWGISTEWWCILKYIQNMVVYIVGYIHRVLGI